jgi:hypothetical protein
MRFFRLKSERRFAGAATGLQRRLAAFCQLWGAPLIRRSLMKP